MRIPVVGNVSTKDGSSNKNARMTNVLAEDKQGKSFAAVRPGLSQLDTGSGAGTNLVCFNGDLINIKIYAEKAGLENSVINELVYTIQNEVTPDPQFSPIGGTYQAAVGVTLTCSDNNATIYYTIDGSTPDDTKTPYSCLLYTSPSPRDRTRPRMPSSA